MFPNPSLDWSYVVLNFWPNLNLVALIKLFLLKKSVYVYTCVCMHAYVCVRVCVCVCNCVYVCVCVSVYVYVCVKVILNIISFFFFDFASN